MYLAIAKVKWGSNCDFPIVIGTNKMSKPWFYYTDASNILRLHFCGYVCAITIPKEAYIEVHGDYTYTNTIIIEKKMPVWDIETIQYLVYMGIDIHGVDDKLLREAAGNGHLDIVQYLVLLGANIHARDDFALLYASYNGHLDVVQYLVSIGANIHAQEDFAVRYASKHNHLDVVKYLVSVGADIHALDDEAMKLALGNGNVDVVQYINDL